MILWATLGIGLVACDQTPADVHQELLPQLAEELIRTGTASRISGLTPEIQSALRSHFGELGYKIGPPSEEKRPVVLGSETGLTFYIENEGNVVLYIGLALDAKMDGYRMDSFYQFKN